MKEISGGQIEQSPKKKKATKRDYPPVSLESAREAYLSYLENQKRSRREGRLLFAFSVLPALLAVGGMKLSLDNSNLLERTWREFIEKIDPDTEEDKKLVGNMKEAFETGELSQSLIDTFFAIESAHGGISERELSSAREEFNKRALQFSELYGREKDDIGLLRAIEKSVGEYEESRTYVSDLLNDKGGNCEARAKYASALMDAVDPALTSHLTLDTLWIEQEDKTVSPHIRLAYRDKDDNAWAVDGSVEPMKEKPSGDGTISQQIAAAVLARHGELPKNAERKASLPPSPDSNGQQRTMNDTSTDSLMTFATSDKVEEYRPGIADNNIAKNKPIELEVVQATNEEWKRQVESVSSQRADMLYTKAQKMGWRADIWQLIKNIPAEDLERILKGEMPISLGEKSTTEEALIYFIQHHANKDYNDIHLELMTLPSISKDAATVAGTYLRYLISKQVDAHNPPPQKEQGVDNQKMAINIITSSSNPEVNEYWKWSQEATRAFNSAITDPDKKLLERIKEMSE
ncbi:MAG: hypothetical protein AAB886_00705 [Patescibacteria group bacterium]